MAKEEKTVERLLTDMANPLYAPVSFGAVVKNLHPTHQQTIMRTIVAILEALAHDYTLGYFDLRNADTLRAAYLMSESIKDQSIDLPYI